MYRGELDHDGGTSSSKVHVIFKKGTMVSYQLRYGTVEPAAEFFPAKKEKEKRRVEREEGRKEGEREKNTYKHLNKHLFITFGFFSSFSLLFSFISSFGRSKLCVCQMVVLCCKEPKFCTCIFSDTPTVPNLLCKMDNKQFLFIADASQVCCRNSLSNSS